MGGWHPDVDEQQVGLLLAAGPNRGRTITGLSDDVEARALEQAGKPFPKQHVVVGQDDTRRAGNHSADYGLR
jgi:hypothetical protein